MRWTEERILKWSIGLFILWYLFWMGIAVALVVILWKAIA
jgi:hypothetical protein